MGLFSGVKKAVSGVFNSAKSVLGSGIGGTVMEGVGSYFGMPGLGTAISTGLGGGGWGGAAGAIGGYLGQASSAKDLEKRQLEAIQLQNKQFRENTAYANSLSQANAREQMRYQTNMMLRQNRFATNMSNTAHQREIADLKKAGLNPILSGTGGMGASTPSQGAPSGAQGSVATAPVASEADAITSAFGAFKTMADAMNTQAQTTYLRDVQTELGKAQTTKTRQEGHTSASQQDLNEANTILTRVKTDMAEHEINNVKEQLNNLRAVQAQLGSQTSLNIAQEGQVRQATKNLQEIWKDLKMKGDISASEYGKLMEMGKRATDVAGLNELTSVLRKFKKGK